MNETSAAEERELIRQFLEGDRCAFNKLMKASQARVYGLVLGMMGDPDTASDITQDAFLRAFRSLHRFRGNSRFSTWVHKIAVNLCLSELRKAKVRQSLSMDSISQRLLPFIGNPLKEQEQTEVAQAIENAIHKLPPRQKAVFLLRNKEELSFAEIAGILKRSEGALRASYFQAIRKLRKELKDHE
ncbi:MAG: sigma-70 family RNA polymerase sigma factor [Candidatus Krumholzibacteria bacterium]|nr:sigma-70 family RNA polymerase sigma factor [Candidatus Krumholzibacteria bacterium]MDP6669471.1 sigma-70 family RNA polymerase sigma factor [Candidatus Krumholzibacteria bacterium]MDP7021130.1 sigma-70 family RNA polymerase sigma factor [Candidatus Krumholzibacteria bacterium]